MNVEPDLSGYAQQAVLNNSRACFEFCSGQGNDPRLLNAAVGDGDSGNGRDADTYAGFNEALLELRDQYAPNVLIGFDVSPWATLVRTSVSTRTPTWMVARSDEWWVEFAQPGGSVHDVLFHSRLDHDTGSTRRCSARTAGGTDTT